MQKIRQTAQVLFREGISNESVDSHIFSVLKECQDFISNKERKKS